MCSPSRPAFEKEEATRPQFLRKAKNGRSQVTGEAGVAESRCIQMFRRVVSYSVISTMVVMVLIAVFSMFVLRVWLVKKEPDEISEGWGDRSTAIINALQIQIMSRVYNWVARKLTDFGESVVHVWLFVSLPCASRWRQALSLSLFHVPPPRVPCARSLPPRGAHPHQPQKTPARKPSLRTPSSPRRACSSS